MAILWELFPVLAAIYLIESLSFLREGTILFLPRLFRGLPFLNRAGFGVGPISPSSMAFYCIDPPVLFSTEGFYFPQHEYVNYFPLSPLTQYSFCSYKDIQFLGTDERDLTLNKQAILKTQSPRTSQALLHTITQYAAQNDLDQNRYLKDSFSTDLVKSTLSKAKAASAISSVIGSILFFNLFILLPVWFILREAIHVPVVFYAAYISGLIVLWIFGLVRYPISSYRLYGKVDWMNTVQNVFCPVSLCHATAYLTKYSMIKFNPFTVASIVLPRKDFLLFARYKYSIINAQLNASPPGHMTEFLLYTKKEYERIAGEIGFSEQDLKAVPKFYDQYATCFCPVCLSEFQIPVTICPHCNVKTEESSHT